MCCLLNLAALVLFYQCFLLIQVFMACDLSFLLCLMLQLFRLKSCSNVSQFSPILQPEIFTRVILLPSATKLRRLCFYRCVSVHRGGGGGGWYPSMPCRWYPSMPCSRSRGVCYPSMHCRWYPSMPCNRSQGGVPDWGVPARGGLLPGGLVSQHALRQTPPGRDGYCCGRYASHWNAFLLENRISG